MRSVSAALVTAFASGTAVLATLVKIEFPGGTIALNSTNWTLSHGGTDYLGAAGLGTITPISDHTGELPGVQLSMINVDSSLIAIALDDVDEVQGSLVTISTAIIDSTTYQIVGVETDWVGYADTMPISEDGATASIGLTAESKGVDLLRGNPLTYSDGDQKSLYPADRAFEYVTSQVDRPVIWPKREWFFK
jgi:hypothetical protein